MSEEDEINQIRARWTTRRQELLEKVAQARDERDRVDAELATMRSQLSLAIKHAIDAGVSVSAIAERLEISRQAVYALLKHNQ